jgi:hypothetical protein
MSSVPAKQRSVSEAAQLAIDVPLRRLSVRQRWEQLRHPDALKDLLDEVALWTAPWTGFALSRQRNSRITGAEWSR